MSTGEQQVAPAGRDLAGGPLDDLALLEQAAAGHASAFDALYRRHADAAWRAARSIAANADDASDAVAEAFTRILRSVKAADRESIAHFRAYLLTATRNAAIDRRRLREDAWDAHALAEMDEVLMQASAPDEVIDLTDRNYVVGAFRELPERWRRVLWLTEVEGLRPVDVAKELGINANAVAQLAFRARAGLRDRFIQALVREASGDLCRTVADRLADYGQRALSDDDMTDVERHLETCHACRDIIEDVRLLSFPAAR